MNERRILSTWKEIASYLSRGVRTVQRWETSYNLPIRRVNEETGSVYAFADELDAWLNRSKPKEDSYVRPTFIVVDVATPNALSDVKLALESAKYNVLTAFTTNELLATAQRFDVDGFVIDSVVRDIDPAEIGGRLKELYPRRVRILISDDPASNFDKVLPSGNPADVVQAVKEVFGTARVV